MCYNANMKSWIFILGHSPALSAEEILTVTKAKKSDIVSLGTQALIIRAKVEPLDLIKQLGGTIKIAELVHTLPRPDAITPEDLLTLLPSSDDEKKVVFGYSLYNSQPHSVRVWQKIGLQLKRRLQADGKQARMVANNDGILSSVAVTKSKLLDREFVVVTEKGQTYLGLTRAVQPFAAYSNRDYGRPDRDDERGMLPPKVAQMMINISGAGNDVPLLDPFCGVGTVAQEATLLGFTSILGTDRDQRAIAAAEKNMAWLQQQYPDAQARFQTISAEQLSSGLAPNSIGVVVTEPYLGPARELQGAVTGLRLQTIQRELSQLYLAVFRQLGTILKSDGRVVMVWPVYFIGERTEFLPLLYEVAQLGFSFVKPKVSSTSLAAKLSTRGTLLYHRPGQIVGREIVVWTRIS